MTEKQKPHKSKPIPNQRSFLVRVTATDSAQTHWRVTIQDLQTHEQHHLPDFDALSQFFQHTTQSVMID